MHQRNILHCWVEDIILPPHMVTQLCNFHDGVPVSVKDTACVDNIDGEISINKDLLEDKITQTARDFSCLLHEINQRVVRYIAEYSYIF